MINLETIRDTLYSLVDDAQDYWQWGAIGLCLVGAILLSAILRRTLLCEGSKCQSVIQRIIRPKKRIRSIPILFCALLWITWLVRSEWSNKLASNGHDALPCAILYTTTLLVTALVIYLIATALSHGKSAPKYLGGGILVVFALHLFGWLSPLRDSLSSIGVPLGDDERIDMWKVSVAVSILLLLLWLVRFVSRLLDAIIKPRTDIPPSIKVLLGKTTRFLFYGLAIVGALKISGVPLGGLAVFSGALGLGLGFGMQKVISNLVSGVIILLDKSIKPGDVIEIEGSYGWINSIRTRYISVITRDRKEILIPNEDFVTNKVINWSFSDTYVRIKADVGVSYSTDIPETIRICTEAAKSVPRVLKDPAPACLLKGFGDSSINLQVRFWINDASEGVSNVQSEVLLAVWKAFRDNNIEIPFPQRDLHIKSGSLSSETGSPTLDS